jgi:hypothetical protein
LNGRSIDEILSERSLTSLTFEDDITACNITACNIYTLGSNAIGYPIGHELKALLDVNGGILAGSAVLSNLYDGAVLSVHQFDTAAPVAEFFAAGHTNPSWVVASNGYVGVGTDTPSYPLTVEGTAYVDTLIASHIQMTSFGSDPVTRSFAVQPFRFTQILSQPGMSNSYDLEGIFEVKAENVDVHLNGRKLAYVSDASNDYRVSTSTLNNNTKINIEFDYELRVGDVLDVCIKPTLIDNEANTNSGGIFQFFTTVNTSETDGFRLNVDGDAQILGSITATGGFAGTGSAAGFLGGTLACFTGERTLLSESNMLAFGDGLEGGKGPRMPFAGNLIVATGSANIIPNQPLIWELTVNGTSTGRNLSLETSHGIANFQPEGGILFNAGDCLNWMVPHPPEGSSGVVISFWVRYD